MPEEGPPVALGTKESNKQLPLDNRVYPELHPSQDPEEEQPLQLLRLDPLQQRLPCTKQSGKRCKSVGLEMVAVQGQHQARIENSDKARPMVLVRSAAFEAHVFRDSDTHTLQYPLEHSLLYEQEDPELFLGIEQLPPDSVYPELHPSQDP